MTVEHEAYSDEEFQGMQDCLHDNGIDLPDTEIGNIIDLNDEGGDPNWEHESFNYQK